MTAAPWNRLVATRTWRRPAAAAYLIAAAIDSLDRPLPPWVADAASGRWRRRLLRLRAGEAKRSGDFASAATLSIAAADGETFIPLSSEYLLSAGAAAFEARAFPEALQLLEDALKTWQASALARLLEPKLGSVANYLLWATLVELGMRKEALPFLYAAAKTHWSSPQACRQWLLLISEAYEMGDERYTRLALEGAARRCRRDEPELRAWQDRLSRR